MCKTKLKCFFSGVSLIIFLLFVCGCKKSQFLDVKPDEALVVPETLDEFQSLLDNNTVMNGGTNSGVTPGLGEMGTGDYYFNPALTSIINIKQNGNIYTWNREIFDGVTPNYDWSYTYITVLYANIAADGLAKIERNASNGEQWDNIQGSALFYRSHAFYQLAQVFAPVYNSATANSDFGIPLKLKADINEKISRSSVAATYARIIDDLKKSVKFLPVTPQYKSRPSKPAAYGLLSRVYQAMGDFDNSLLYADSCLMHHSKLLSYSSINPSPSYPFQRYNEEVIFSSLIVNFSSILINPGAAGIDPNLYNLYQAGDLRKTLFFRSNTFGGVSYRGSYANGPVNFTGIATDEILLNRAEALARKGNKDAALADLNTLLAKRWNPSLFVPATASDANAALDLILLERRKELVMRGLRWTDLRRLNKLGANIQLTRVHNGVTYTLPPNDPRYTYPIPPEIIGFNPSMPQNIR